MKKGKYAFERRRAKEREKAQREGKAVELHEGEGMSPRVDAEQKAPSSFWGIFKRPSITDWFLVAFTSVLAGVGIYQYLALSGQLEVLRLDQRSWMQLSFTPDIKEQSAIVGTLHLLNTGKNPARHITGSVTLQTLNNGDAPAINPQGPYVSLDTGMLFPSTTPVDIPISRQRSGMIGIKVISPEPIALPMIDVPITPEEMTLYNAGKLYFVVEANITYDDVFGKHWTHFCHPIGVPTGAYSSRSCFEYNDADGDETK